MNRTSRPEELNLQQNLTASIRGRSRSSSSTDVPLSSNASTCSSLGNPLLNVVPEPAYIAPSAAARLVTGDHEAYFLSLQEDGIVGPEIPTMCVTEPSLRLVNQFLDFLLYTFLSSSKSTSLELLRPAVVEILRARLAKEALAGADQELQSYLGGDEEPGQDNNSTEEQEFTNEWDLEATWRKARVQCMVYSSLGDLEEDDEVFYSENVLEGNVGLEQYQKQSCSPGLVSPAVAIWLTSILEFIGEQTLLVAGHATIARYSAQRIAAATTQDVVSEGTFPKKAMVEELDTEKVALNPSLGRIWRQWRKKVRGVRGSFSIPTRDTFVARPERRSSIGAIISNGGDGGETGHKRIEESNSEIQPAEEKQLLAIKGTKTSANIYLTPIVESTSPIIGIHHVQEQISVNEDDSVMLKAERRRPQSLILLPCTHESPFTLSPSLDVVKRPRSLPDLKRGDFADPLNERELDDFIAEENEDAAEDTVMAGMAEVKNMQSNAEHPNPIIHLETIHNRDQAALQEPEAKDMIGVEEHTVGYLNDEFSERKRRIESSLTETERADDECESELPMSTLVEKPLHSEVPDQNPESYIYEVQISAATPVISRTEGPQLQPSAVTKSSLEVIPVPEVMRGVASGQIETIIDSEKVTNVPENEDVDSEDDEARTSDTFGRDGPHASSTVKQSSISNKHIHAPERKIGQLALIPTSSSIHSVASDRSTGVRVFTPPATPDRTRRSSSFSKAQRPIHTSGSTSSQTSAKLKSFIPWPVEAGKHGKVQESDNESRSSLQSDRILDDKERSFEELISGGGTIHYTITPDPIRNMTLHDSPPRESVEKRTPTAELADFLKNTSPEDPSGKGSAITSRMQISRSSTRDNNFPTTSQFSNVTATENNISKSAIPKTHRMFIADSGSSTHMQPPKSGNFHSPTSAGVANLSPMIRQSRSDTPLASPRTKQRLLAREASGTTGSDTTSALADFFRNTNPPIDGENITGHRISRTVAPFRTTMDSTQFDGGADPERQDAIRRDQSSTPQQSNHESYQSSSNSTTALLRSSSRKHRDYGSTSPEAIVKRTQVRNKDPYPIDFEGLDDDDDDLIDFVLPKKREEESLIDFLKNAPPPPQSTPEMDNRSNKIIQKKTSSHSLMSRFSRSSSRKNSIASNTDKIPQVPTPRHVPLKVNHAQRVNHAHKSSSDSDLARRPSAIAARANFDDHYPSPGARPSGPSRIAQARGGRTERNDTDSLAAFLKHTAPPESPLTASPRQKEAGRSMFKKITFSRR